MESDSSSLSSSSSSCTATASSSTANLGPGYDVFGLGLDAFEDTVKITTTRKEMTISNRSKKQITIKMSDEEERNGKGIEGGGGRITIPSNPEDNSAGLVVKRMAEDFHIEYDLDINILKKVPAGFGMGSSAASAAAAAVAFDNLFDLKIEKTKLVEYAAEGEVASAGIKHYDNVSGSLLGGFVIVRTSPKLEFIRIEPPKDLVLVIAVPLIKVPKRKTEVARSVLPSAVPLKSVVHNVSNASTIVAGFMSKDIEMIAKGIDDVIVEPARKHLIPGYDEVKRKATKAGALAVTISGAGPSIISFLKSNKNGKEVADAMAAGFKQAKIESMTVICHPSTGAKVVS
ncbi:MAG TPA: homoserine kinase, partial [Nitrososphaera sp.]|nr:homoserine kinase [Nitrososphaera sp.]